MKIDDCLPEYQVSARYSLLIRASAEQTYRALANANLTGLPIVRRLMRLRSFRLNRSETDKTDLKIMGPTFLEAARRFGPFLELAHLPQQEIVLGIAGRFWRPDSGIIHNLSPAEFLSFDHKGYAKAVWNFSLEAVEGGSQLSTETRVQTFGRSATLKFRIYWLAVGPFSGMIRKAMLREVKRIAEQQPA
jgi:hypothetical protein